MLSPYTTLDTNQNVIKKTAIIYCRLSRKNDNNSLDKNLSLESQRNECIKFCIDNNLPIKDVVYEVSSAYKNNTQKKLDEILNNMTCNDILVIWELSRFSRNVIEGTNKLNILKSKNAGIYSVNDKFGYPMTCDFYDIVRKIIKTQQESDFISERVKRSYRNKKENGSFIGIPPFGKKISVIDNFKNILVDNDEEVNVINNIINMYEKKNLSVNEIKEYLNNNNILRRNNLWTVSYITKIINEHYKMYNMNTLKKQLNSSKVKTTKKSQTKNLPKKNYQKKLIPKPEPKSKPKSKPKPRPKINKPQSKRSMSKMVVQNTNMDIDTDTNVNTPFNCTNINNPRSVFKII